MGAGKAMGNSKAEHPIMRKFYEARKSGFDFSPLKFPEDYEPTEGTPVYCKMCGKLAYHVDEEWLEDWRKRGPQGKKNRTVVRGDDIRLLGYCGCLDDKNYWEMSEQQMEEIRKRTQGG